MTGFARTDRSLLSEWWWTIDRWTLGAVFSLLFAGAILVLAASPAVAVRIGLDSFYLVRHHYAALPLALIALIGVSTQPPRQIRRLGVILFLAFMALTALTLFWGQEIKGARRWIDLGIISIQPSEFLKPTFAIFSAWMFSLDHEKRGVPGNLIAVATFALVVALLINQPDLGMTGVIAATWFAQFFVAGLPFFWVTIGLGAGIVGLTLSYFMFSHVAQRINQFLDPQSGDSYQIDRALEAFHNGGFYGTGPGEGSVKLVLPDAHADFIFAVAGEEFGLVFCLVIVALFAFIVLRAFLRELNEQNMFILLAVVGLATGFGLQAIINMASTLHLMPTKGMTLPFLSYGGSSSLAIALGVGMMLALTRKRFPGGVET